ncbi:MAG: glycosyltransferase family 4 protein [Pseudomonadota bacterium]
MKIQKLKIIQANNYFYYRGGAESCYFAIMRLLASMGHDVFPFSTKNKFNCASPYESCFAETFDPDALRLLPLPDKIGMALRTIYSFETKRRMSRFLERTSPDLAHCHNIYGALSPSVLCAFKERGLPVVMTVHDVKLLCPNHRMYIEHAACERCKINRFYNCAFHKCMGQSMAASVLGCVESYIHRFLKVYRRNVDVFITPSVFLRAKLIEYGFPADQIISVPNFINVGVYSPDYEYGDYVIFFGRLEETKGLNILMDAASELKGVVKIVVAGSGPMEADLRRRIVERDVDNVRLLGNVEHGKGLIDLIRNSMFSVVPSIWHENFPQSILESYACGKPVIGANIGGIPEMIDDGETGMLFQASDAEDLAKKIRFMIGNRSLVAQMGRAARKKVMDEYLPEIHYERMCAVYSKLLGNRQ